MTTPAFSRVEIRTATNTDLLTAAINLKKLAGDLEFIAGQNRTDEDASILAHHKIKSISQVLRGTHE